MSVESDLRAELVERYGPWCRWADCDHPLNSFNPLEMAHIAGKGMGGRPSANRIENVVLLCRHHHRILDRSMRFEVGVLLKAYLAATR